jgi:predicted ATP-dependent endonuclease of OLD family
VKITSIGVKNFRSFRDRVELTNLKKVNAFVGPNKAGKSNIFEALSLFKSLAGYQQNDRNPLNYHFDKQKQNSILLEIVLELSDRERCAIVNWMPRHKQQLFKKGHKIFKYIKYLGEINPTIHKAVGSADITEEHLSVTDNSGHYVKMIHHRLEDGSAKRYSVDLDNALANLESINDFCNISLSYKDTRSVSSRILAGSHTEIEYRIGEMMTDFLKQIRIFPPSRSIVHPRRQVEEGSKLSEDSSNLVSVIHALEVQQQRKLFSELKKIVDIKDITTPAAGTDVTVSVSEEGLTSWIDLDNLSFGLQQILILLVAIITAEQGQTICIEEPEMNIHSSSQKMIFNLMRSINEDRNQFFLTTHSSIFTDVADDVSTYLITKTRGCSTSMLIEQRSDIRLIKQQLGIRNSDIYGSDCVLFVEGDSEETFFSIIFPAMKYMNLGKEVRLCNLEGQGKVKKLRLFLSYLKEFDTKAFIVMDQNEEIHDDLEDFVKEGLLRENHWIMWSKDFEDLFESEMIVAAMKNLSQAKQFAFNMDVSTLDNERQGKRMARILQEYMYSTNKRDFIKVDLARELANRIVRDIHSEKDREESNVEKEIKKIMHIVLDGS